MYNNTIKNHPFTANRIIQMILYLFVNTLFILKYLPRIDVNTTIPVIIYCVFIIGVFFFYQKKLLKISENLLKIIGLFAFIVVSFLIIIILIKIDPLSVRVDRWSAVTYFLDGLFKGEYPYAISTHVSASNFPSPFPAWHYLNIPFYLMGDVGIGLIFFLAFFLYSFFLFSKSYKRTFFLLLLLALSPAYWWEVAVRSDSLSNAMLVLSLILIFQSKSWTLHNHLTLIAILTGIIVSTRLSAALPIALFLFPSFLNLNIGKRIRFLAIVSATVLVFFLPYILWDTQDWIFFKRNPFMSQSSVGNVYLLIVMIIIGVYVSVNWKNFEQYLNTASSFIFVFILASQICLIMTKGIQGNIFSDSLYDISYFSLILPYCIASLTN